MCAIKYAVSHIERQTIERAPSSVIQSRDANDVVINAGGAHFETKVLYRRIFQGKRLGERGIGAGPLAKTRQRIALELLFSNLAYIGADGEAEQMLGVDRVGTCDDRPESNDGRDDQQHRLHDLVVGDFTVDRQTAWMSIGSGVIYLHCSPRTDRTRSPA